jgi:hypothetical protein
MFTKRSLKNLTFFSFSIFAVDSRSLTIKPTNIPPELGLIFLRLLFIGCKASVVSHAKNSTQSEDFVFIGNPSMSL